MRIREFEVSRFGCLENVHVADLPTGLVVFQGRNEAGKSTLMEFFRIMLTGPAENPDSREQALLATGTEGGRLVLDTARHGVISLRRRSMNAPPELYSASGDQLSPNLLAQLTGGIGRELYAGIFGVGLSELQGLSQTASVQVRDALVGASFGTGLRPPRVVLAELEQAMNTLFSTDFGTESNKDSKSCAIDVLLRRLEQMDAAITAHHEVVERYHRLQSHRADRTLILRRLETERDQLDRERRGLERRLEAWQRWEEWRLCGLGLERLPTPPANVPSDAPRRLERLEARLEEALAHTERTRQALERDKAALAAVNADRELTAAAPQIKELGERKASCRNAMTALPRLHDELTHTDQRLHDTMQALGPAWTMERIRTVSRGVQAREHLNQRAEELILAENARNMATEHLERVRQAGEEAARTEREARLHAEQLPIPVRNLDDAAREALRQGLTALDESRDRLTRCEAELKSARMDQQRALAPLHLLPGNTATEGLNRIAAAQDEALGLARDALACQRLAAESKDEADRARASEDVARRRFMRLRDRRDDLGAHSRTTLDNRRLALRHLRRAADLLPVEEYNLREAEDALALHMADKPVEDRNPWLMLIGFILVLLGAGHVAAMRLWGISEVALSPELSMSLVAFHGYLILLAGLTFMAAGLPRKNPDAQRHSLKAAQLRDRVETAKANTRQLHTDLNRLCAQVGADSPDPARLDALEAELERAQEQCVTNERLDDELTTHQQELDDMQAEVRRLTAEHQRLAAEAAAAQRRWHDKLEEFGVRNVMHSPDSAENFFARVDMARAGVAVVNRIHEELRELESRAPKLMEVAKRLLPVEAAPAEWSASTAETAVRAALDACRQADLAAEERARAVRAIELAGERLVREAEAQTQVTARAQAAEIELEQARSQWREALCGMGLLDPAAPETETMLSPAAARQVLRCMDDTHTLDAEHRRLTEDQHRQEQERDALLIPLRHLLDRFTDRLGSDPSPDADVFTRLDALTRLTENALRAVDEENRLAARVADQQRVLIDAETLEADARERLDQLLAAAGADSGEALLTVCAMAEEREALLRRQAELRDQLRLIASPDPAAFDEAAFVAFLDSFAVSDRDELDCRRQAATARLQALETESKTANDELREHETALAVLRAEDRMPALLRERENLAAEIRSRAEEWGRLAVARQLLREARSRFERESQPAVIRAASALFTTMTAGRWVGVHRSLDDESLRVLPASSTDSLPADPVPAEQLSRGTREQLHLALRLAHARIHAGLAAPLPLLLDDVLVNFDPDRARHAASALADMTHATEAGPGSQILFFTCHPHITSILSQAATDVKTIDVAWGKGSSQ